MVFPKARSLFCSLDTLVTIAAFFPRYLQKEEKKTKAYISDSNIARFVHRSVSDMMNLRRWQETNQNGDHIKFDEDVPPEANIIARHASVTRGSDYVGNTAKSCTIDSVLSAEEEKEEETSSTITFRMNDGSIVLPKWVVEKYGAKKDHQYDLVVNGNTDSGGSNIDGYLNAPLSEENDNGKPVDIEKDDTHNEELVKSDEFLHQPMHKFNSDTIT